MILEEALDWGCAGIATSLSAGSVAGASPVLHGKLRARKSGSSDLCDPENPRLGAMALTEPGAGSDVKAIQTRAVRDGDEWVINGAEMFLITNGGIADLYVVFAKTDPMLGYYGVSRLYRPGRYAGGCPEAKRERKMEIRASWIPAM